MRDLARARVLLVTGEFPPMQGGVGDYTWHLAQNLARVGSCVAVATSGSGCDEPANPTVWRRVGRWDYRAFKEIRRLADEWRADVIHLQYQAAAYAMHPAANLAGLLLRGRPFVVTFHDLRVPYLFPKAGGLRSLAVRLLASSAKACIATNDEDADQLRRSWLARRSRLSVIPIGSNIIPTQGLDRAAVRKHLGIGDAALIVYFGFLHPSKGIDVLLGALAALVRRDCPVRLLMLGGTAGDSDRRHSEHEASLRAFISDAGLQDHVHWTGFLTPGEVSAHLSASDVAVLPFRDGVSYRHGTLLAAIAHGLPIVTTCAASSGQVRRLPVLRHGEDAMLVPPGEAGALAEAIAAVVGSTELRIRLGEASRRLSQRFGWESIASETLVVYRETLGLGRGEMSGEFA